MKKTKKHILKMTETSMIGAGASIGLAGVGGTVAHSGQAGIQAATGYMPAMGSVMGAGMVMRSVEGLGKTKRRKKRR